MNPTPRIAAPTRAVASMARRIHPAEVDRLAQQVAGQPHATAFRTISETSGKERVVSRIEVEWLLLVTGRSAA